MVYSAGSVRLYPLIFVYYSLLPMLLANWLSGLYVLVPHVVVTCTIAAAWAFIRVNAPNARSASLFRGVVSFLILLPTAIVATLQILVLIYFDQALTTTKYVVILESNSREILGAIGMYADARVGLALIFLVFPWLLQHLRPIPGDRGLATVLPIALLCVAIGTTVLSSLHVSQVLQLRSHPLGHLLSSILEYQQIQDDYTKLNQNQLAYLAEPGRNSKTDPIPNTLVIVLGESTSRIHLGIYGYPLDTTPLLQSIAEELVIFKDVISPHSHTIPVLKKALLLNGDTDNWVDAPSVITIFRAAGYKTWWLSNQDRRGLYAGLATNLAGHADISQFTEDLADSTSNMSPHDEGPFDELLLPLLDEALADDADKKLIILHVMGNHSDYKDRYPSQFKKFQASHIKKGGRTFLNDSMRKMIAEYDNAVLYNDHIVSQSIHKVRSTEDSAAVLYLSDHGEEVFDTRKFAGHTESASSRYMIEIPFIIWYSRKYRENYPDRIQTTLNSQLNPYMTDDLAHTLLDLAHVNATDFRPERSIVNSSYQPKSRIYAKQNYDIELVSPTANVSLPGNMWAHRVNTLEKLRMVGEIFAGVELDLVIEASGSDLFIDIRHPPVSSIGLTLDRYLDNSNHLDLDYWLDFKNLDSTNAERVALHLDNLLTRYKVSKDKLIVESPNSSTLAYFNSRGFYTSYYLPNLDNPDIEKHEQLQSIIQNTLSSSANGVSFSSSMYDTVTKELITELPGVDMLSWHIARQLSEADTDQVNLLLANPRLKVLLMHYETDYDR